jgi:hypothetical protein
MAICAKEGLDIGTTAKLVCPFCDTAVLLQGAVARPQAAARQTLSMAGRDYPLYTSLRDVGVSASRKARCGYHTTFKNIVSDHKQAMRFAHEENKSDIDYETDVMVKCAKCQSSLSKKAIEYLIMSEMAGSMVTMGGGSGLSTLLEGHCPKCGGTECYYLFDPSGFDAIRAGGAAPEPEKKKKGFWPFK